MNEELLRGLIIGKTAELNYYKLRLLNNNVTGLATIQSMVDKMAELENQLLLLREDLLKEVGQF